MLLDRPELFAFATPLPELPNFEVDKLFVVRLAKFLFSALMLNWLELALLALALLAPTPLLLTPFRPAMWPRCMFAEFNELLSELLAVLVLVLVKFAC